MRFAFLQGHQGWSKEVHDLYPGGYAVVLSGEDADLVSLEGRLIGLELRDTVAVMGGSPILRVALLFRKPLSEATVAHQALIHGTASMNIDACRVGTSGGTTRGEQAPYPKNGDGSEARQLCWARTGHRILSIDAGRWPANVLFVGPTQMDLFPEAKSEQEVKEWFERLLGGVEVDRAVTPSQ